MAGMTETSLDWEDWEAKNPGTCQKCKKPYKEHRLKPGFDPAKGYYVNKDMLCPFNGLEQAANRLKRHEKIGWLLRGLGINDK